MRTENNHRTKAEAGRARIPVYFIVICLICSFFLIGCDSTISVFEEQNRAEWQTCIDTGGVPIRHVWSSQIADCLYK